MKPARILLLLLLCSSALFAKSVAAWHYLPPGSFSVQGCILPPPEPGAMANSIDIQQVFAAQQSRTPADIARAQSEATLTPAAFDDVLGPWFTPARLPVTFQVLQNAAEDAESVSATAKQLWARQRPPLQNPEIHPVIPLPDSPSYPSGHAMRGALWSFILAKLAPDLRDRLIARGYQIGRDRVIAGVHFPTDVQAGHKLGHGIATRLLLNPAFQADLARAKAEFDAVRPKPVTLLLPPPSRQATMAASSL